MFRIKYLPKQLAVYCLLEHLCFLIGQGYLRIKKYLPRDIHSYIQQAHKNIFYLQNKYTPDKMNSTKADIVYSTIYQACSDEIRKGVRYNRKNQAAAPSKENKLVINENNIATIYQSKGSAIPPDEILSELKTNNLKIPIKSRDTFPSSAQLPSAELLNVLHYYISHKCNDLDKNERAKFLKSNDETALLALGIMVEEWIDELVTDENIKLFVEDLDPDENDDSEEDFNNEEDS